jgi:hypothetical protein
LNYRICCPNVPIDLGVRQGAGAQDARRSGRVSLRDRALLSVGLQVGLRRAEIAVSDLHHAAMTRCGWCARAAGATRSPSTRRPRRGCAPISNFENERLGIFDTAAAHVAFGYDIAVFLREAFEPDLPADSGCRQTGRATCATTPTSAKIRVDRQKRSTSSFRSNAELENLLMKARQDTARFCCGV